MYWHLHYNTFLLSLKRAFMKTGGGGTVCQPAQVNLLGLRWLRVTHRLPAGLTASRDSPTILQLLGMCEYEPSAPFTLAYLFTKYQCHPKCYHVKLATQKYFLHKNGTTIHL